MPTNNPLFQALAAQVREELRNRYSIHLSLEDTERVCEQAGRTIALQLIEQENGQLPPVVGIALPPLARPSVASLVRRTGSASLEDALRSLLKMKAEGHQAEILFEQGSGDTGLVHLTVPGPNGEGQVITKPYCGQILAEMATLLGAPLPDDQPFSQTIELSDGTKAFLSVHSRVRRDPSAPAGETTAVSLSIAPWYAPRIALDDLGITQVERFFDSIDTDTGIGVIHGEGMRTTMRALAALFEEDGLKVVWVEKANSLAALQALDADVYMFSKAAKSPAVLELMAMLAQNARVIAASRQRTASGVIDRFLHAGVDSTVLGDILLATLLQVKVARMTEDDAGDETQDEHTLLTELVTYGGRVDIESVLQGLHLYRELIIDAAEKVRADEVDRAVATEMFGDLLDVYL